MDCDDSCSATCVKRRCKQVYNVNTTVVVLVLVSVGSVIIIQIRNTRIEKLRWFVVGGTIRFGFDALELLVERGGELELGPERPEVLPERKIGHHRRGLFFS